MIIGRMVNRSSAKAVDFMPELLQQLVLDIRVEEGKDGAEAVPSAEEDPVDALQRSFSTFIFPPPTL